MKRIVNYQCRFGKNHRREGRVIENKTLPLPKGKEAAESGFCRDRPHVDRVLYVAPFA